jgi:hypothetical protein
MKKTILSCLLFLIFFAWGYHTGYAGTSQNEQFVADDAEQTVLSEADNQYGWQSLCQNLSVDNTSFYGKNAYGFHLRPAWRWQRFEGQFDLAFYQNPWDDNQWQWGTPEPGTKPSIPDFVDSISYHGDRFTADYQKINDLNFGYGLLINKYHIGQPYHGFSATYTPGDFTKLTYTGSYDLIYLAPFTTNKYASLQLLQFDQAFSTGGLHWQLDFTGAYEAYPDLDRKQYAGGGAQYDLTLTNVIWCSPFLETADLNDLGGAGMLGVQGRLGLVNYQTGVFQTHNKFLPNYFGGNYEDLKWNSWSGNGKRGLPTIDSMNGDSREGFINRLGIELSPWLNIDCINIDDTQNTTIFSLSGNIERLGVAYGFFYNGNGRPDGDHYDWFLKGGNGFAGYEYHYYYDSDQHYRQDFELTFKF